MKRLSITSISPSCKKLGSLLLLLFLLFGMGRAAGDVQKKFQNPVLSSTFISQEFTQLENPRFLMPRADAQLRSAGDYHFLHLVLALTDTATACRFRANSLLRAIRADHVSLPGDPYGMLPLPHGPPVFS